MAGEPVFSALALCGAIASYWKQQTESSERAVEAARQADAFARAIGHLHGQAEATRALAASQVAANALGSQLALLECAKVMRLEDEAGIELLIERARFDSGLTLTPHLERKEAADIWFGLCAQFNKTKTFGVYEHLKTRHLQEAVERRHAVSKIRDRVRRQVASIKP
jgi:hypothetical protein